MLNLTKFAVRKPVTIIMCLLTIAYFGIQSLLGTKVELTPEMEFPMLVVSTVYAGASPDDIKDLIANKKMRFRHWMMLKTFIPSHRIT